MRRFNNARRKFDNTFLKPIYDLIFAEFTKQRSTLIYNQTLNLPQ